MENPTEFSGFSFALLLLLFIISFLLVKIGKSRNRTAAGTPNLPPGPWKLPFIGNIHQLAIATVFRPPHGALRDFANKYGPLMHLQLGEVSTVVVSSPETAKQVMKTHDSIFASRPRIIATQILSYNSTNLAFAPYGQYWRQVRKICTLELLSTKRVQSFRHIRQQETSALMNLIANCNNNDNCQAETINLTEKIYPALHGITSRAAFGRKSKNQKAFIPLVEEAIQLAAGFNIADIFPSLKFFHLISGVKPKLDRLHSQMDAILQNIVDEHKANYSYSSNTTAEDEDEDDDQDKAEAFKDLVDVLLKYRREDGNVEFHLSENNIKAVILDIFTGGSETSATTIDWAMSEMLRNPGVLKKAQDEVRRVFKSKGWVDEEDIKNLEYLQAVIKETLRLHPPVPLLLPRENNESCKINGYEIPVKTRVVVNAWAINRDPRYWEDAQCFKPERFIDTKVDYNNKGTTQFEYIPFGAGRRICPGITFGLANVELMLAKFLYHFDWDLPTGIEPEDLDMRDAYGITVRRKADIHVVPTLRNPLAPAPAV